MVWGICVKIGFEGNGDAGGVRVAVVGEERERDG